MVIKWLIVKIMLRLSISSGFQTHDNIKSVKGIRK